MNIAGHGYGNGVNQISNLGHRGGTRYKFEAVDERQATLGSEWKPVGCTSFKHDTPEGLSLFRPKLGIPTVSSIENLDGACELWQIGRRFALFSESQGSPPRHHDGRSNGRAVAVANRRFPLAWDRNAKALAKGRTPKEKRRQPYQHHLPRITRQVGSRLEVLRLLTT